MQVHIYRVVGSGACVLTLEVLYFSEISNRVWIQFEVPPSALWKVSEPGDTGVENQSHTLVMTE